jgi:DNA-binding XRE family transcriptional regulator
VDRVKAEPCLRANRSPAYVGRNSMSASGAAAVIFLMNIAQITAARELLHWTKADLAERARINRRTVSNVETGKHVPHPNTLHSIRRAFEEAGIEFVESSPGVRLRAPREPRQLTA